MPRLTAREISRIETTYSSELGTFSWSWVVRADGEVQYRLSHVNGRRERNPWQSVCRLTAVERRAITLTRPGRPICSCAWPVNAGTSRWITADNEHHLALTLF